jgi:hypothetical protein
VNFKGTHLGTLWELDGEHVGKHIGNKGKKKNLNPFPPSPSKRKKIKPIMSACCAFPLATWNFSFQNCSSPFLARAEIC